MKLTKRLIPAFAMLLVSAVLMSTASFAWFSMNTNVTATGMTVSAKSDSIFLEIYNTKNGVNEWDVVADNTFTDELFPVAHESTMTAETIETLSNWYYYYATDPDVYNSIDTDDKKECKVFSDYVAHTTYKIRLNPQMVTDACDVYVSSVVIPADTGITLIVQYGDNMKEFNATNGDIKWTSDDDNIIDTMTGVGTEYEVNVYIYIDGNNPNVNTNNADALTGLVSFTLSASGAQRTNP